MGITTTLSMPTAVSSSRSAGVRATCVTRCITRRRAARTSARTGRPVGASTSVASPSPAQHITVRSPRPASHALSTKSGYMITCTTSIERRWRRSHHASRSTSNFIAVPSRCIGPSRRTVTAPLRSRRGQLRSSRCVTIVTAPPRRERLGLVAALARGPTDRRLEVGDREDDRRGAASRFPMPSWLRRGRRWRRSRGRRRREFASPTRATGPMPPPRPPPRDPGEREIERRRDAGEQRAPPRYRFGSQPRDLRSGAGARAPVRDSAATASRLAVTITSAPATAACSASAPRSARRRAAVVPSVDGPHGSRSGTSVCANCRAVVAPAPGPTGPATRTVHPARAAHSSASSTSASPGPRVGPARRPTTVEAARNRRPGAGVVSRRARVERSPSRARRRREFFTEAGRANCSAWARITDRSKPSSANVAQYPAERFHVICIGRRG